MARLAGPSRAATHLPLSAIRPTVAKTSSDKTQTKQTNKRKEETMKLQDQITLGHLLGTIDGTLEPDRYTNDDARQACWQNREDYLQSGLLPWRNPGADAKERKAVVRVRDELAAAGLAVVGGGGKLAGLTAAGLKLARELCGTVPLGDALCGLDYLADPANDSARWTDGSLSEATLAGLAPTFGQGVGKCRLPDKALGVVDAVLPLLVAGLVEWRTCGFSGAFLYSLTAEGRSLAEKRKADGAARPEAWAKTWEKSRRPKSQAAADAWLAAWDAAKLARQTAKPPMPNVEQHEDPVDPPKRLTA